MPRARFITFEGIDGAGKSTHMGVVARRLQSLGLSVVCTREPGGTALAETLRGLILDQPMDALTETLLVFAARRDHLARVIEPALQRSQTVLCDRFTDATFAYQGGGRGFDATVLATLEHWVQQGRQPDLTLWFDVPVELAARRRAAARGADRFEAENGAFFERVADAYRQRMAASGGRIVRIDGARAPGDVERDVLRAVEAAA